MRNTFLSTNVLPIYSIDGKETASKVKDMPKLLVSNNPANEYEVELYIAGKKYAVSRDKLSRALENIQNATYSK